MRKKSLVRNIVSLIALTVLLKGLGFLNRILIAYFYGTTELTDVFYNAFGFVESIVATMTASLTVAVTNIYIENKKTKDNDIFVSTLVLVISIIMLILSMAVFVFTIPLGRILAPGYVNEEGKLFGQTLWILSLSFPFQGIIAVYSSVLQAEKRFTPVKLTGTISNIITIGFVIVMAGRYGINALVISYFIGTILNTAFLIFSSRKEVHFTFKISKEVIQWKRLLRMMVPLLIATAAHEINLMIDRSIASNIAVGAVSALSYSCLLYLFVENVIINSLVMAIFPELKENAVEDKQKQIAIHTNNTLFFGVALLTPIALWTIFNASLLTKTVYMRGNFDDSSLVLTSAALVGYMIGLPFLAIRNICTQVFYANGNTKTPVIYNLIGIGINIVLDFILPYFIGLIGITLATSISIAFSGIALLYNSSKINSWIFDKNMRREIRLLIISNCVCGMLFYVTSRLSNNIVIVLMCFLVGMVFESIFLILFGSKKMKDLLMNIRNGLNRKG